MIYTKQPSKLRAKDKPKQITREKIRSRWRCERMGIKSCPPAPVLQLWPHQATSQFFGSELGLQMYQIHYEIVLRYTLVLKTRWRYQGTSSPHQVDVLKQTKGVRIHHADPGASPEDPGNQWKATFRFRSDTNLWQTFSPASCIARIEMTRRVCVLFEGTPLREATASEASSCPNFGTRPPLGQNGCS